MLLEMDHDHHNPFDIQGLTLKEVVAGSVAGLAEHIGMFPFDTIKTRMQSESLHFSDVARKMLFQERWAHMYRGCVPVLCSAVPAHGAYFSIYEAVKRRMGGTENASSIIVSAACATLAHDSVSIPFDVIKQRMQVDAGEVYRNSMDCVRSVIRNEGAGSLYRALPTTVMMNVPHIATQWLVYERIKEYLVVQRGEEENETALGFVLAGLAAGSAAAVVSTPLDNVKTRLQLGFFRSAREAVRSIYRTHGARGFMTGALPRACNMAPSAAITMATYETAKSLLTFLD